MRPVCLNTIFLHYILPCLAHNLIRDKLVDLIERIFSKGRLFILDVMMRMLSSHLMQSEIIIYVLVRNFVKLSPFS